MRLAGGEPGFGSMGGANGALAQHCVGTLLDRPSTSLRGRAAYFSPLDRVVTQAATFLARLARRFTVFFALGAAALDAFLATFLVAFLARLTVRFFATFGAFLAGALRAVLVLVFFAAMFFLPP